MTVLHMDCREGMRIFPENTFDAIVTDPPYELGFMGKAWDSTGIANSVEMWREALRVLKPGGHLLAFSGSRTYHRMACAIEDAGFEIRDQIMWVYGSGCPKSLDVSKAIDKAGGSSPADQAAILRQKREAAGLSREQVAACVGCTVSSVRDWEEGRARSTGVAVEFIVPSEDYRAKLADMLGYSADERRIVGVAVDRLVGTVAANVLAHGTGALNIDGCRVAGTVQKGAGKVGFGDREDGYAAGTGREYSDAGRWPANLIHDGSDEVLAAFPDAAGQHPVARNDGEVQGNNTYGALRHVTRNPIPRAESTSSAARFFYCAKASRKDRGPDNTHPTVKPTDLMRYLCRLVTPPGGLILDPFAGSGSTFKAATLEGFDFIGFELQAEYVALANERGRA
jgi:DNA modification methylase/transcriptional regulator with XRE-family HTH domain